MSSTAASTHRIEPDDWYPMETFERMGLAILAEIAHGELETVRSFGRVSIDWLCNQHPTLLAKGDPLDTLMRFQVLRRSFFDYAALEMKSIADGEAALIVGYCTGMVFTCGTAPLAGSGTLTLILPLTIQAIRPCRQAPPISVQRRSSGDPEADDATPGHQSLARVSLAIN